ncbi:hypothetical protein L1887_39425 [Cichorium endivia]|nr:hypothetical protein L1887_39425 [Cichorium endivia]
MPDSTLYFSKIGELLSAVGRDANNQMYPIAWAVVAVENKHTWKWFLDLLLDDIDMGEGRGLTLISDQHKGLIEAVKERVPEAEHRQCSSAPVEEGLEPDANNVDETVREAGVSQEQVDVQPNQGSESGTLKRQRGHSERITKLKLKRKVTTADGSGDIEEHPISLE